MTRKEIGRNMRRMVMLALAGLLISLSACRSDKSADAGDLLSVVPSSATLVGVIDIRNIAEKTGCSIDGMEITPGDEMRRAMDSISDPKTKEAVKMIFAGESGIEPGNLVFFADSYDRYLLAMVADTGKFREYVERQSGEKFVKQGDVETCGNIALCGGRAWMNVFANNVINAQAVGNYSKLSEANSFMSRDNADKLADTTDDITLWSDINTLASMRDMSVSEKATMHMALASIFDDASFITFSINFEKGKVTASGSVLNAKGKPAKYLLPAGKIDLSTVKSLGGKADMLFAMDIDKDLVKKIEGMAASFGGGLPTEYLQIIQSLDGTFSFAIADYDNSRNGIKAVVTTNGKPAPYLLDVAGVIGSVKNDGKYVRIAGDNSAAGGNMDIEAMAELIKGSTLGFVVSNKVVSSSPMKVDDSELQWIAIMLKPSGKSMDLNIGIAGNNADENFLITFIKMMNTRQPVVDTPVAESADSISGVPAPGSVLPGGFGNR